MSSDLPELIIGRKTSFEVGGEDNKEALLKQIDDHSRKNKLNNTIPTKFFSLGGIGEVGKNTYCLEHGEEIIIIDAGIKFANKKLFPGLMGTVAPVGYLLKNQHKIKALFITHGHEDHIGGIPHLLKKVKIPVIYTPVIASELIKKKLSEHSINDQKIVLYTKKSIFSTEHFIVDFFKVNHSIPDAFGICIATPNGNILSSGDFRFDFCSQEDKFDLQKIQVISSRKIDLLLCESTNAEQTGFNESEKVVISEINNIISSSPGRVIITFFASNLGRIEEIIKIAINSNRKIIILGRSIDTSISSYQKIGYLKLNKKVFISPNEIVNYQDNEILVVCTGSQGEENAVLSNISKNKHQWIKLKSSDNIIFSSNVIPGNASFVDELINRLYKSGCNIFVNSSNLKIHSSGHASKMEQQLFVNLVNPAFLIPIHGETRMLKKLKRNCVEIGFPEKNIFILENGKVAHLLNGVVTMSDEVIDAAPLCIVGNEVTNHGLNILQVRKEFGREGILMMHAFVDYKKQEVLSISPITNIGSFYLSESINLLKKVSSIISKKLNQLIKENASLDKITSICASLIKNEVYETKKQNPYIKFLITDTNRETLFENSIVASADSIKKR